MEIRIWLPDTLAGWRYCLRHPRSFVIGRYGFKKFVRQRDMTMAAIARANRLEDKMRHQSEKMRDMGRELSRLKRNKSREPAGRERACKA